LSDRADSIDTITQLNLPNLKVQRFINFLGQSACMILGFIFAVVTFLNQWTGKAQNNILIQIFIGMITVFDVFFVFCAGLMFLAVVRMWKSLES
jgi:hypothetical protein